MRMRRKTNLTPRMEKCAHLLISQPDTLCGKWLQTFGYKELHLEIGCGKGLFIAKTAKNYPDVLFVALEKTANVLITALELAVRENLQNVRYINGLAESLPEILAPGEISRIYINFCDPWPARRHIKRRLVFSDFLQQYKVLLRSGGEIHFKTDNLPLFEFALREFKSCGFALVEETYDLHKDGPTGVMTEYEQRFYTQGQPIYWCRAQK